jgi:hypothetical protein
MVPRTGPSGSYSVCRFRFVRVAPPPRPAVAVPAAAAEVVVTGIACVAPAPGWGWDEDCTGGLRNVCRPEAGYAPAGCAPGCCGRWWWDG